MVERGHGRPPPRTTSTFDAAAWGDTSFSGARHEAVLFADVDLSDVTERTAVFVDCAFREVRFAFDPLNVELGGAQIDAEQATTIADALGRKVG